MCLLFEISANVDHLFNLVTNGEANGYGHQIGNLVSGVNYNRRRVASRDDVTPG